VDGNRDSRLGIARATVMPLMQFLLQRRSWCVIPLLAAHITGWLLIRARATGNRQPLARMTAIVGLALAALAQAIAWALPKPYGIVIGFLLAASWLRLLQLSFAAHSFSTVEARRLVFGLLDPRPHARSHVATATNTMVLGISEIGVSVAAFMVASAVRPFAYMHSTPNIIDVVGIRAARVLLGAIAVAIGAQGADHTLRGVLSRLHIHYPKLHDAPHRAGSLADFWGRRWNRLVGGYFREVCFPAWRERWGATRATLLVFLASATLHFVPTTFAAGVSAGSKMAAFFLVHGVALQLERQFAKSIGPRSLRMWTWCVFVLTMPLFVEPLLEALGA
jgi:Membrane bound O-acyl transferase family